jgi:Ternary complex associated domain 9
MLLSNQAENEEDDIQQFIDISQEHLAYFTLSDEEAQNSFDSMFKSETIRFLTFEILERHKNTPSPIDIYISKDIIDNIDGKINKVFFTLIDNFKSLFYVDQKFLSADSDLVGIRSEDEDENTNELIENANKSIEYLLSYVKSINNLKVEEQEKFIEDIEVENKQKIIEDLMNWYKKMPVSTSIGTTALLHESWYQGTLRNIPFLRKSNKNPLFLPVKKGDETAKILKGMAKKLSLTHLKKVDNKNTGSELLHCGKRWQKDLDNKIFQLIEYSLIHQSQINTLNSLFIHYPLIVDNYFFIGIAYLNTERPRLGSKLPEMYDPDKYPKMLTQINLVAKQIKNIRKRKIIEAVGIRNNTDELEVQVWIDAVTNYFPCFDISKKGEKKNCPLSSSLVSFEFEKEEDRDYAIEIYVPEWIKEPYKDSLTKELEKFLSDLKNIFPKRSSDNYEIQESSNIVKPSIHIFDKLLESEVRKKGVHLSFDESLDKLKKDFSLKLYENISFSEYKRMSEKPQDERNNEASQTSSKDSESKDEIKICLKSKEETPLLSYNAIAHAIPFTDIEKNRHRIAAFIIGLEWGESDSEKSILNNFGYAITRLLVQSYPEIPCFISTGKQLINIVQQSLANGAAWCFHKQTDGTHHLRSNDIKKLTINNLNKHLSDFAALSYGTYQDLPNPNQFDSRSNPREIRKLEERLKIKFDRSNLEEVQEFEDRLKIIRGKSEPQNFKLLIARLFTTENISVTKVMSSGKSGAAATFFVSPSGKGTQLVEATRFVKVGYWLEIQKEYMAYQQVIKPKLNNHIARIIQPPAVVPSSVSSIEKSIDWNNASIVSSLAGFPESYDNIRPLQAIFDLYIADKDPQPILDRVLQTIEYVLVHLQLPTKSIDNYSFAEEAPCLYTGKWIEHTPQDPLIADKINGNFRLKQSRQDRESNKRQWLDGWLLTEIKTRKEEENEDKDYSCNITLTDPDTKVKIKLRGKTQDIIKSFSALWIRLGMPVRIFFELDSANEDIEITKKRLMKRWNGIRLDANPAPSWDAVKKELHDLWIRYDQPKREYEDLIDFFVQGDFTDKKLKHIKLGGIHGDLNLNNILYPKDNTVGFLIDFSESKLDGLAAFDLAWLEAQIWNYYLFPNIVELVGLLPSDKNNKHEKICELLKLALTAINTTANPNELFAANTGINLPPSTARNCIENVLTITYKIRKMITDKLEIEFRGIDVNYALTVCFYRQAKFDIDLTNKSQKSDWINLLSYLCSIHYFDKLVEQVPDLLKNNAAQH